jgi:hypothetical protein
MGRPKGIPHTEEWKRAQAERMQGKKLSSKPRKWKLEDLPAAIQQAKSWTDACLRLGLRSNNGAMLKPWVEKLRLSTDHFTSEWQVHYTLSDGEIFCENSGHVWAAKKRFYKQEPEICVLCSQGSTWNGLPLRFQIDHKNGDSRDCRRENLQKICPNCHTQTDTYCGRNRVVTDGARTKLNGETIWCNRCSCWLEPNAFGNKVSMPNGKQSYCKNCMSGKGASNGA